VPQIMTSICISGF